MSTNALDGGGLIERMLEEAKKNKRVSPDIDQDYRGNSVGSRRFDTVRKILGILTLGGFFAGGVAALRQEGAPATEKAKVPSIFGLSDKEFGENYVRAEQQVNSAENRVTALISRLEASLTQVIETYNAVKNQDNPADADQKKLASKILKGITTIIDAANMIDDGRSPIVLKECERLDKALRIVVSHSRFSEDAKNDIGDLSDVSAAIDRLRTKAEKISSAGDEEAKGEPQQLRVPNMGQISADVIIEEFFREYVDQNLATSNTAFEGGSEE